MRRCHAAARTAACAAFHEMAIVRNSGKDERARSTERTRRPRHRIARVDCRYGGGAKTGRTGSGCGRQAFENGCDAGPGYGAGDETSVPARNPADRSGAPPYCGRRIRLLHFLRRGNRRPAAVNRSNRSDLHRLRIGTARLKSQCGFRARSTLVAGLAKRRIAWPDRRFRSHHVDHHPCPGRPPDLALARPCRGRPYRLRPRSRAPVRDSAS